MRRLWLIIFIPLIIPLYAVSAHADTEADRQRAAAQLAEAGSVLEGATDRAKQAAQAYAAATAALPQATLAVAHAKGLSAAATANADQARREADTARSAYQVASTEYAEAASRVEEARDSAAKFAAAAYRGSGLTQVNVVLASRTPNDLADRLSYLDQVSKNRAEALAEFTTTRTNARLHQNKADSAKEAAEGAEAVAAEVLKLAKSAEAAAVTAAAAAEDLAERQRQALAVAGEEKEASLARYAEIKAMSDQIEANLRNQPAEPVTTQVAYRGGYFPMPVRGAWKSSDFGQRYDPYYNVWQLHAGVDLAAGGGTPIYAVADGRVVQAGWNGGYGNYTCINHGSYDGRTIATCYAHQSAILVNNGQSVKAGQLIGRVGTTGASTGNHLHFEVRLNGAPVQPLTFLPSCLC